MNIMKFQKGSSQFASNVVKLRDTSALNRQRRSVANGYNKDEPHSSSGNWSASSESGRTSVGSEVTIQPKSSPSNTLNNCFHSNIGPSNSVISRRRFFNTSTSSSITSEGNNTPDLQQNDTCNDIDETCSAYSCDTEGYYTSFHMDSGLRTLKEEESTVPMQTSSIQQSCYSFGSNASNQSALTLENEYELYGKGSTSTTSSAGTVCTTLIARDFGPDVPERISSRSKLDSNTTSGRSCTLSRYHSTTTHENSVEKIAKENIFELEKTDTPIFVNEIPRILQSIEIQKERIPESIISITPPLLEWSECSDFEGVEQIERFKKKTALTTKRIPSMCVITPTTSDDENVKESLLSDSSRLNTAPDDIRIKRNYLAVYDTISKKRKERSNINISEKFLQRPTQNTNSIKQYIDFDLKATETGISSERKNLDNSVNNFGKTLLGKSEAEKGNIDNDDLSELAQSLSKVVAVENAASICPSSSVLSSSSSLSTLKTSEMTPLEVQVLNEDLSCSTESGLGEKVFPEQYSQKEDLLSLAIPSSEDISFYWSLQDQENSISKVPIMCENLRLQSVGLRIPDPYVPPTINTFATSTPTKTDSGFTEMNNHILSNLSTIQSISNSFSWKDEPENRVNTCSDRMGLSKMTLIDFKKLLLSKSAKTCPVKKKVSAVEVLRKKPCYTCKMGNDKFLNKSQSSFNLNVNLHELSRSPKVLTNRRTVRQVQLESPSRSFGTKQKTSVWQSNNQRTDIMSITIPEANIEEDSSASDEVWKSFSETDDNSNQNFYNRNVDLESNLSLQTEKKNFMDKTQNCIRINKAVVNTENFVNKIIITKNGNGTTQNKTNFLALETAL